MDVLYGQFSVRYNIFFYLLSFLYFLEGVCTLQMQDAVLSQLSASPAAVCAVPVMCQERKKQTAVMD